MKNVYKSIIGVISMMILLSGQVAHSAQIASSDIENDGTWTIGTTALSFEDTAQIGMFGLAPTAGNEVMHFNNGIAGANGTNTITFTGTPLAAGQYTVLIDVGNYNNQPLATFNHETNVGMTAGGTFITPTATATPDPAFGTTETWTYSYTIAPGDPLIGQDIGFTITVPAAAQARNVAFDNLRINFVTAQNGTQGVPTLSVWGIFFLTLMLGLWAKRESSLVK